MYAMYVASAREQMGFTIVETVVALAVFALVGMTAMSAYGLVQSSQRSDNKLDLAHSTAKSIIEEVRSGGYDTVVVGETYDYTSQLGAGLADASASLRVDPVSGMPSHKLLRVEVQFDEGAVQRKARVTAIVGPEGL